MDHIPSKVLLIIATARLSQPVTADREDDHNNPWIPQGSPCSKCNSQQFCDKRVIKQGECRWCLDEPCYKGNTNYEEECPNICPDVWNSIQAKQTYGTVTPYTPSTSDDAIKHTNMAVYITLGVVGVFALLVIGICVKRYHKKCLRKTVQHTLENGEKDYLPLEENNNNNPDEVARNDIASNAVPDGANVAMVHSRATSRSSIARPESGGGNDDDAGISDVFRRLHPANNQTVSCPMPADNPTKYDRMLPDELNHSSGLFDFRSDGPGEILCDAQEVSQEQDKAPAKLVISGKDGFTMTSFYVARDARSMSGSQTSVKKR